MSQVPDPLAALWPVAPSGTADWLRDLTADDGLTGFLPPPLPDAAWVLNAMYEAVDGLAPSAPGAAPGGGLGRTRPPGPGWRRLRWAELSRRTGDPMVPEGLLPSYRCFPSTRKNGSRPLTISPPTEGSLDRETWTRADRHPHRAQPSRP